HLRDAVVYFAEQPATSRLAAAHRRVAEDELAGGRDLDAHLLLDPGGIDAVALTGQLAGLRVEVVLRDDEQAQAVGARASVALESARAGQDEVDDVLGEVVLARGDEAVDGRQVLAPVGLRIGLGATGADVGAGVRVGEDHGGAPAALDDVAGDL